MLVASFLALAAASAPVDHPRSFLLSVVAIPLSGNEALMGFSFETWGVRFKAVCHIPYGWRIKAGSSLTPNGTFEGQGSQGVTFYRQHSPRALQSLVLVDLYRPVQPADVHPVDGGIIPATFKGNATVETDAGDRKVPLDYRNIRLTPATHCPTS